MDIHYPSKLVSNFINQAKMQGKLLLQFQHLTLLLLTSRSLGISLGISPSVWASVWVLVWGVSVWVSVHQSGYLSGYQYGYVHPFL